MKKVCVISPLGYTGLAYYDFSLCYALSKIGLEVDLFSVDRYIVKKKPNFNREEIFINTYGDISRIKKGINYLISLIKCFILILKKEYEIIHFQILEMAMIDCVLFALLKLKRKKIVYTPHDIIPFKYKVSFPIYLTYKLADLLIVHNETNRNDLINHFGIERGKISVIHHGNYNIILEERHSKAVSAKKLNLPSNREILLFFGCIRNGKGLNTLLKAYQRVVDEIECVLLVIAGKQSKGFDLEKSFNIISAEVRQNNVELREKFIPDEQIQYYYEAADLILLPYEEVYESGVLKFAFSCKRPVLVSDIPVFKHDIRDGENAFVFRKGDPIDLANKIINILNNKDQMESVAENAKLYSDKNWDWNSIAIKTKINYEKIL